jgi:hypothetical protein
MALEALCCPGALLRCRLLLLPCPAACRLLQLEAMQLELLQQLQ